MSDYTSIRELTRPQRRELNKIVRKQRRINRMNKRQALKAASERIEAQEEAIAEYERLIGLYKADVKDYYDCIEGTVDGKSICAWCHYQEECKLEAKNGKGCTEWTLKAQPVEEDSHEG